MKNEWFYQDVIPLDSLDQPIQSVIELLSDFQADGYTHCDVIHIEGVPTYLAVKREETDEERKCRKEKEKKERQKERVRQTANELKLLAKLKKKYEGKQDA